MSSETESVYIAIAYRWGWTNNHWYIVAAGRCYGPVSDAAESECEGRGGKYGVAVWDSANDEKPLEYYPSSYDEKEPHHNIRIELLERLGHAVTDAVEGGGRIAPAGECPQWLKEYYEQEKRTIDILYGQDAP